MQVTVYTDGSARGNPGPGGYGAILVSGKHHKELSGGYRLTTNNRMELLAVITAIESMKMNGLFITVYTDSKYVCEAVTQGWVFNWEKKDFKGKKNADLWKRFLKAYANQHVSFRWVKGHNGHPENERCDKLATAAADSGDHAIDEGFESGLYN